MFRFWKTILCLFSSCCLFSSAHAEDLDPVSSAYLSNKEYAKNIEVQAYFVTKDQLAKLFSEEDEKIIQKTNKELYGKEIFLLVRVKNRGELMSFGILNCKIPSCGDPISVEIMMMPGHMQSFHDSVLYIGPGSVFNDDKSPTFTCVWKSLYSV